MKIPKVSDLLDPSQLIKPVIQGYKAYRGYRMLAFGAESVGKTTFWRYLETRKAGVRVEKTVAPTGIGKDVDDPLFRLRDIRAMWIKVGIRAFDVPGDLQYRSTWGPVLEEARPHGVVFMLDHDQGNGSVPPPGYTPARLTQHNEAFRHLRDLILGSSIVQESLKALFVVVNKHDVWHNQLSYGDILKESEIYSLASLGGVKDVKVRYSYCSALAGDNVTELVRTAVGEM